MTHSEFVEQYRNGTIQVRVDRMGARRFLNSELAPKRYMYANLFWAWIWLLSIPAGIVVAIWVKVWLGILLLVISIILPRAIRTTEMQFTLQSALENENIYNILVKSEVIIIEKS